MNRILQRWRLADRLTISVSVRGEAIARSVQGICPALLSSSAPDRYQVIRRANLDRVFAVSTRPDATTGVPLAAEAARVKTRQADAFQDGLHPRGGLPIPKPHRGIHRQYYGFPVRFVLR